jgi:hypothetical protein
MRHVSVLSVCSALPTALIFHQAVPGGLLLMSLYQFPSSSVFALATALVLSPGSWCLLMSLYQFSLFHAPGLLAS